VRNMADVDRDSRLLKAREKLDKFRKKKKIQEENGKQSSSSSSPIMFTAQPISDAELQGSQHSSSTTESLRQLSSEISGLLAQPTNFDATETTKEYARKSNEDNNKLLEEEIENLRMHLANEKTKFEQKLKEESFKLKDQLEAKTKAIEFLVSRNAELESSNDAITKELTLLKQEKQSLEQSVENLGSACTEMRMQAQSDNQQNDEILHHREQKEKEVNALKELLLEKEENYKELQLKLSQINEDKMNAEHKLSVTSSELEMCKVHLQQMRGSGGHDLLNQRDSEISNLKAELTQAKSELSEATMRIEKLVSEQDLMTEQYRNYSRDLASQTEKMAEQMRKYKDENTRLTKRESSLVVHVGNLETQMQKFIKGGKNVTEEEICRLKENINILETDLRFVTNEKEKLQEMFTECKDKADDYAEKLSQKTSRISELQAKISSLETSVDMLQSSSEKSCTDQAELLAACESDKVAASMAMQQNVQLKDRLEELDGAVVQLTNSKADLLDQLEDAKQRLNNFSSVEAKISAMNETVKEKDIMCNNLKNHIKYLEEELKNGQPISLQSEVTSQGSDNDTGLKKELDQSREYIRSLNSQICELQSKLEVLSSQTRECSESPSSSQFSDGRTGMVDTDSDSGESYIEVESTKTAKDDSSESFVELVQPNLHPNENNNMKLQTHCLDNLEALKHLEKRFISAMEQLAELSSDKEQLEYLVERLQQETETVGDYVIMYQHQRMQQKIKIQEKEEEVRQLAKDRADLQEKLQKLQGLVTNLVSNNSDDNKDNDVTNDGDIEVEEDGKEKRKILDLLSEIDSDSSQIIAKCEVNEPWFWENSAAKVMTV